MFLSMRLLLAASLIAASASMSIYASASQIPVSEFDAYPNLSQHVLSPGATDNLTASIKQKFHELASLLNILLAPQVPLASPSTPSQDQASTDRPSDYGVGIICTSIALSNKPGAVIGPISVPANDTNPQCCLYPPCPPTWKFCPATLIASLAPIAPKPPANSSLLLAVPPACLSAPPNETTLSNPPSDPETDLTRLDLDLKCDPHGWPPCPKNCAAARFPVEGLEGGPPCCWAPKCLHTPC